MADGPGGEIRASGAVVWRPGCDGPLVALIHRPRYDDWSFPKGKRDPGEHPLLTAVREVREETGITVWLGRRLESTSYLSEGRPKRVDYWVARPAGLGETGGAGERGGTGETGGPGTGPAAAGVPAFVPNAEVDKLEWLSVPSARERLSYAHDVKVLEGFAAGAAGSTPLVLVRHAATVGKQDWRQAGHRDDLARPLTARGMAQAVALSRVLRCFPPARVITSGAERCVATIRPYAALTGAVMEAVPSLTLNGGAVGGPGSQWQPTAVAREMLAGAVAGAGPVVICAHRQNLPSLLAWACEELAAPVPQGPPLGKGAFWVLQASGGALASAERHHPAG
jgi:8-oxo-(d)GTP phosphatase